MSLNGAIDEHRTEGDGAGGTYRVKRTPAREYDSHGRLLPAGSPTEILIVASVQGASSEDVADLPEGQNTTDSKVVLTTTELRTRKGGNEPDTIVIKGRTYRIDSVEEVEHWGETHYECVAVKADNI